MQTKHDDNLQSLHNLIKRSFLLKDSFFSTFSPDPDVSAKGSLFIDTLPKILTKRWNQAELDYFNLHLNKSYGKNELILLDKDVYYKNIILFIQHFQNLIIFPNTTFFKVNIATSIQSFVLEWYTSKLSKFYSNTLKNNPDIKNWINILSYHFKVLINVVLGFLTNKTYSLNNVKA